MPQTPILIIKAPILSFGFRTFLSQEVLEWTGVVIDPANPIQCTTNQRHEHEPTPVYSTYDIHRYIHTYIHRYIHTYIHIYIYNVMHIQKPSICPSVNLSICLSDLSVYLSFYLLSSIHPSIYLSIDLSINWHLCVSGSSRPDAKQPPRP